MNYQSSLRYLEGFINLEKLTYCPDSHLYNLDRMHNLIEMFDHPEKSFFPILIAGTKGKGSTGFYLESILKAAGIRVGFYNSPHILEPTERIRLQGQDISKEDWVQGVKEIREKLRGLSLRATAGSEAISSPRLLRRFTPRNDVSSFSYFEILTLLAILVFAQKKIQVGIFEVGMGGRLDATNILKAPLVILTPISLDHEAVLGNTIAAIAREKAGVIHAGSDVVVGRQPSEALRMIRKQIRKVGAKIHRASSGISLEPGLPGDHQKRNAALASKAAEILLGELSETVIASRSEAISGCGQRLPSLRPSAGLAVTKTVILPRRPPKNSGGILAMTNSCVSAKAWDSSADGSVRRNVSDNDVIRQGLQSSNWPGRYETINRNPEIVIDAAHNPTSVSVLADHLMKRESSRRKVLIFGTSRDKNYGAMLKTLSACFSMAILTASQNPRSREIGDLMHLAKPHFKTIFPASNTAEALRLARTLAHPKDLIVATGSFYLIGEIKRLVRNQ
ncbi:MAG: hypothetical protein EXS63_06350 [Candidatus Omnitrophica bacterium]|nr:hypothetical protein [Candidatus Omnitrophota bacterium]